MKDDARNHEREDHVLLSQIRGILNLLVLWDGQMSLKEGVEGYSSVIRTD
jgi:hypothetical protein